MAHLARGGLFFGQRENVNVRSEVDRSISHPGGNSGRLEAREFVLEFLDSIKDSHESLAKRRQRVLNAWWHFGIRRALDNAESREFVEALGEDFAGKPASGPRERSRPRDALANLEQDVHGPLAAHDALEHGANARRFGPGFF